MLPLAYSALSWLPLRFFHTMLWDEHGPSYVGHATVAVATVPTCNMIPNSSCNKCLGAITTIYRCAMPRLPPSHLPATLPASTPHHARHYLPVSL